MNTSLILATWTKHLSLSSILKKELTTKLVIKLFGFRVVSQGGIKGKAQFNLQFLRTEYHTLNV